MNDIGPEKIIIVNANIEEEYRSSVSCSGHRDVNEAINTAIEKGYTPPAPGTPFHLAFPVHNLEIAKFFYGEVMNLVEGRSSERWQDYSLEGHQIVAHWVGNNFNASVYDHYNPVDGDEVPVPHFGLSLSKKKFMELSERFKKYHSNQCRYNCKFIIEPTLRFEGRPGEQQTMFLKDPR